MNIFILDYEIDKCAKYHCDKHVVKMVCEYAQLISGALRLNGIDEGYKLTHINHPCSKWIRKSRSNFDYVCKLIECLNDEYKFRYNKEINHKAFDKVKDLFVFREIISDIGLTPFALAMPEQYKHKDPVLSYREYYIGEKREIAKWKNREIPHWWR